MRNNWTDRETASAWADAVKSSGDIFHRFILKPYLASAIRSVADDSFNSSASALFYEVLSEAFGRDPAIKEEVDIDRLLAKLEPVVENALCRLSRPIRVLDLGGGEGFIGRWLARYSTHYVALDVSPELVRIGTEKAGDLGSKIRFGIADLNEISAEEGFERWLRSALRQAEPISSIDVETGLENFDLVLCTNVLDHLSAPLVFLRELARACGRCSTQPPVLLTTLNPDFFVGAEQWPQRPLAADGSGEEMTVRMGPARRDVQIVPRSWMQVESMLNSARFNVLSCDPVHISQYPSRVQSEFTTIAGLRRKPAGGPFVLWSLKAAKEGESIADTHTAVLSKFDIFKRASAPQLAVISERWKEIARIEYAPGELITHPSNLPHGFYLVERGAAVMLTRGGRKQVFAAGSVFGELESGRDVYVSRFLYPIRADVNGCTVLCIDQQLFTSLLDADGASSLGNSLFGLLRDRVSTYSWIYHRGSGSGRAASEVAKGVTERDCESVCRTLLFHATMEGGKLRKGSPYSTANNGLSVLLQMQGIKDTMMHSDRTEGVIGDSDAAEGASGTRKQRNTPYKHALQLLHAVGAIDGFSVQERVQMLPNAGAVSRESFSRLLVDGVRLLLLNDLQGVVDARSRGAETLREWSASCESVLVNRHFESLIPAIRFKESSGWSELIHGQIVTAVSDDELKISKNAVAFTRDLVRAIYKELNIADGQRASVKNAIARFVFNMAFLKNEFYRRTAPRFIVIGDMYFLRRVAMGATDWRTELLDRAKASPYVAQNGRSLSAFGAAAAQSDGWRFESYLDRFESHVKNYWVKGLDLMHTAEGFSGGRSMVKDALKELALGNLPSTGA